MRPPLPCGRCGDRIVWARTEAGRPMPVDADPYDGDDERANLALMRDGTGGLVCRVITADRPIMGYERRGMPHFATCHPPARDLPDNVIPFPTATRKDHRP